MARMNVTAFTPPVVTPPRRFHIELSEDEAMMLDVVLESYLEYSELSGYTEKQLGSFRDGLGLALRAALK